MYGTEDDFEDDYYWRLVMPPRLIRLKVLEREDTVDEYESDDFENKEHEEKNDDIDDIKDDGEECN